MELNDGKFFQCFHFPVLRRLPSGLNLPVEHLAGIFTRAESSKTEWRTSSSAAFPFLITLTASSRRAWCGFSASETKLGGQAATHGVSMLDALIFGFQLLGQSWLLAQQVELLLNQAGIPQF